jgi:RNA polymerase I-specific transcription initiation factor RRN3
LEIQVEVEELDADDSELMNMDGDIMPLSPEESYVASSDMTPSQRLKGLVAMLDGMLSEMLRYLATVCKESARSQSSADSSVPLRIFSCLLASFDRILLPTHKSRHVQFLLFYLCSLQPAQFAEAFLALLIQRLVSVATPLPVRANAAYFLGSFLARAKFLQLEHVRDTLEIMAAWANHYLDATIQAAVSVAAVAGASISGSAAASSLGPDPNKYHLFYAVVQSMMYALSFRMPDLLHLRGPNPMPAKGAMGAQWVRNLGLQRIMDSKLNPLRVRFSS